MPSPSTPEVVRLLSRVSTGADCWLWKGPLNVKSGYAYNGHVIVHRRLYELLIGPVPHGMELDHLCRVRSCVNPSHLEPVTQQENNARSNSPTAINARKTACDNGHEYSVRNTYVRPDGHRDCRRCKADRERQRRAGRT